MFQISGASGGTTGSVGSFMSCGRPAIVISGKEPLPCNKAALGVVLYPYVIYRLNLGESPELFMAGKLPVLMLLTS